MGMSVVGLGLLGLGIINILFDNPSVVNGFALVPVPSHSSAVWVGVFIPRPLMWVLT